MFSDTQKNSTLGPFIGGIVLLLFGGQALMVWHGGHAFFPDFPWMTPPIQYDAAWGFALCGMGLIAFGVNISIFAGLCAVGVFVIGLVRLLDVFIPGLGVSVAPVFAHFWLPPGQQQPLPPLIALAFVVSGYAIGALKYRPYTVVRSVMLECMALMLLVLALIFIFASYSTGPATHQWLRLGDRDALNALGFIGVGASILYFVFFGSDEEAVKARRWVPLAIWLAACAGPVALWQGMRVEENRQIRANTRVISEAVEREIAREITTRIEFLKYFGSRWSVSGASQQQWEVEAQQLLQGVGDFESIYWVNPDLSLRWTLPGNRQNGAVPVDAVIKGTDRKAVSVRAVDAGKGKRQLHIHVPISSAEKFHGWLVITVGRDNWLRSLLGANRFQRYAITMSEGAKIIGDLHLRERVEDDDWAHDQPFDVFNAHWVLRVMPTRTNLNAARSVLPETALGVGLLLATLLAVAVFLIQIAVGRSRSLARVNELLALDIDARKRVEEALRESERKLRIVVDNVQDHAIFMLDENGKISTWNKGAQQLTGYNAVDTIGRDLQLLYPDDELPAISEKLAEAGKVGVHTGECWHMRKDGSRFCGDDVISAIRGGDANLEGFAVIIRDQTERIELRKETEQARDYYFRLFSSFPNLVWRTDAEGQCDYCNPAWLNFTGRKQEQEIGAGWMEGLHPDDRAMWLGAFEQSRENRQPFEIQYRLRRADGQYGWIICSCKPYYNVRGEFAGFLGACYDNTIRRRMEAEVEASRQRILAFSRHLQTVREEEKARLARELHDELGATLTALRLEISALLKRIPEAGDDESMAGRSTIQLADSAIQAIRRIITDLRPSILDNLGLIAALRWQAGEFEKRTGIKVELQTSEGENNVSKAHALALFRIFQEALTNVLKHARASNVTVLFKRRETDHVLEISDDGVGMADGADEKMLSHGIVGMRERARELHGELVIASSPGNGTTVTVTLPDRS